MHLNKNRLPARVLDLLEQGGDWTIDGLAQEFGVSRQMIAAALARIRKVGFHYIPQGTILNPQGGGKPGILRNAVLSKNDIRSSMAKNNDWRIIPHIESQAQLAKDSYLKHPEMIAELIDQIEVGLQIALDAKREIKKLANGNPKLTT